MPDGRYDAIVVGAGPNGLAAAITLAQAGRSVLVMEKDETAGGGTRSAELTLPGFIHDVCSAVHPFGLASPFLRALPLHRYGLRWRQPEAPLAHPLDGGTAVLLERSIGRTAVNLGRDGGAYCNLLVPFVANWRRLMDAILAPLRLPPRPWLLARFGLVALWPAQRLAQAVFRGERAQALFAGSAAHAIMPLEKPVTAAFGLVLNTLAHAVGWPVAEGGSQRLADSLVAHLQSLGGTLVTEQKVSLLAELPPARAILCDLTPAAFLRVAGDRLPALYRRRLERYRYGPGVCKVDWALDGPIPWQAEACRRAATVHVGGTMAEIGTALRDAWDGRHPQRPFVLLAQPSLFDESRAPAGRQTAWAYCHVPNGSREDMAVRMEEQVERFAPGFGNRILARNVKTAAEMEAYNPNYAGGDINGGVQDVWQLFTRPVARLNPYTTPVPGLYLCSSATPPGGGVHGMCGYQAARAALNGSLREPAPRRYHGRS
jgi:phytoene dehydrogenase-like protein